MSAGSLPVRRQKWVFDRPVLRDPLFVAGLVLGIAGLLWLPGSRGDDAGTVVFKLATAVPWALFLVGITAGSVREYARGRDSRRESGAVP